MRNSPIACRLAVALGALMASPSLPAWSAPNGDIRYEVRFVSERAAATAAGEDRDLSLQSATIQLRESIGAGVYGGFYGGLPSIRWQAGDTQETPRMGGRQVGLLVGGRHPARSPVALVWEGEYRWSEVSGELGDEGTLQLDLRETLGQAGLQWRVDRFQVTAGLARRLLDGEETRNDSGQRQTRPLSWVPDNHAFLELNLGMDDGGWLAIRHADSDPGGSTTLIFGRRF